jgi:hypothetical protein
MTAAEWLAGATKAPKLASLEKGFTPTQPKEFVTSAKAEDPIASVVHQMTDKEYQDQYHILKKEKDELLAALASKDARIRQLEAQLAQLSSN